jgi:AraC family transcriptional regulator
VNSRRTDPKLLPVEPVVKSTRRGWVGLEAAHFRTTPAFELHDAVLPTHHTLALFVRPPEQFDLQFGGVTRHVPPSPGSIIVVPAGVTIRARSSGHRDVLHVYLEPAVVERVAAEAFELEPAQVAIRPLDGLQHPQLRSAMLAVNDEVNAAGGGARLAAESLANVLAVHLIRNACALRPPARRTDGMLSPAKLQAVIEYIDEYFDTDLTVAQLAAVVHLSPYHFARQFKVATGLPPHQYVLARRVDRAQQLMRNRDLPLVDIAASAGFSDQSKLCTYFKRAVGLTPRQFRKSASNA